MQLWDFSNDTKRLSRKYSYTHVRCLVVWGVGMDNPTSAEHVFWAGMREIRLGLAWNTSCKYPHNCIAIIYSVWGMLGKCRFLKDLWRNVWSCFGIIRICWAERKMIRYSKTSETIQLPMQPYSLKTTFEDLGNSVLDYYQTVLVHQSGSCWQTWAEMDSSTSAPAYFLHLRVGA